VHRNIPYTQNINHIPIRSLSLLNLYLFFSSSFSSSCLIDPEAFFHQKRCHSRVSATINKLLLPNVPNILNHIPNPIQFLPPTPPLQALNNKVPFSATIKTATALPNIPQIPKSSCPSASIPLLNLHLFFILAQLPH
jgi:hypothetical protein